MAYLSYASGLGVQGNALREVLSRAVRRALIFRGVRVPFRRWLSRDCGARAIR